MNEEKIRFVILRETDKGTLFKNVNGDNFNELELGFSWEEFVDQVGFLVREGYLSRPLYADNTIYFYNSTLTEKGEKYLQENQWYSKAYRTAKEIKGWISV